jgi:hypothetical protein
LVALCFRHDGIPRCRSRPRCRGIGADLRIESIQILGSWAGIGQA